MCVLEGVQMSIVVKHEAASMVGRQVCVRVQAGGAKGSVVVVRSNLPNER